MRLLDRFRNWEQSLCLRQLRKFMVSPRLRALQTGLGCEIFNKESTVAVNCALLDQDIEVLEVKGPRIVIVDEDVSVLVRKRQETAEVKDDSIANR